MRWCDQLLEALLPGVCPGCGAPATGLCPPCSAGLAPAPAAAPPAGVDWWVSAFAYEGALRELVARAKYRGARAGWAWLPGAVAAVVADAGDAGALQAVTWPPTTAVRRRRRGWDPAEWLARGVARELSLPASPLLRRRPGPAQTGRDRRSRAEHGPAFSAQPFRPGACVLVVDDVATTGATLSAAAAALRERGAGVVAAATAARTPHPAACHSRQELTVQAQGAARKSRFFS